MKVCWEVVVAMVIVIDSVIDGLYLSGLSTIGCFNCLITANCPVKLSYNNLIK